MASFAGLLSHPVSVSSSLLRVLAR